MIKFGSFFALGDFVTSKNGLISGCMQILRIEEYSSKSSSDSNSIFCVSVSKVFLFILEPLTVLFSAHEWEKVILGRGKSPLGQSAKAL